MKRSSTLFAILILSSGLAACGGGGGAVIEPAAQPPLEAPTAVGLLPAQADATLSWEPVAGALGYRVFLAAATGIDPTAVGALPEGREAAVPASDLHFTFTGLPAGVRYYAAVCAIGDPSDSPLSTEVSALLAPGRPEEVALENGNRCVTLRWTEVPGAERYDVYVAAVPGPDNETWETLPEGAAYRGVTSAFTICDLYNGMPYFFVVQASNESGSGPLSEAVATIVTAHGTFEPGPPVAGGSRPVSVTSADFDGDGISDLAVCDALDGTVIFHRGTQEGHADFAGALEIEDPLEPSGAEEAGDLPEPAARHPLAVADFNGDGFLDVALGLRPGNGVRVYLGDGGFGFSPSDAFATDADVRGLITADLDADGAADLVVVDRAAGVASIWLGGGDGTFAYDDDYAVGEDPSRAAAGDVDGDGTLDLVVTDAASDSITLLLGDGDGGFTAGAGIDTADAPEDIALGDLDGDGDLDLVVTASGADVVQCFLGTNDGTFTLDTAPGVGSDARDLALEDLNGDGTLDLVVSNHDSGSVLVFTGIGNGGFEHAQTLDMSGDLPGRIAVGDYNGDGRPDLAIAGIWNGVAAMFFGAE